VFVDEAQFTFEPKQSGNGYPTEQMHAPKNDKKSDVPEGFEVFSDDGVPF
jgi:hypothetical protein